MAVISGTAQDPTPAMDGADAQGAPAVIAQPIPLGLAQGAPGDDGAGLYTTTDPVTPPEGQFWPSSGGLQGAPGGLSTRASVSKTTASLAAAASEQGTIQLASGYRILRVTTSAPARVRIYTTAAKQTADLARAIGTDAVGDAGCMLEYVSTTGTLAADLSPVVDGFDGKSTPDGLVPVTITNTGTGSAAITVTLNWLRTE